jgi:hypothetical protein
MAKEYRNEVNTLRNTIETEKPKRKKERSKWLKGKSWCTRSRIQLLMR